MSSLKITKRFSFEMAHALLHYDGACRNIHGHSYKMDVTVKGKPNEDPNSPKAGMIMDFGDLKKIVHETIIQKIDHALVLNHQTEARLIEELKTHYEKIVVTPFQPTTERLLLYFVDCLQQQLPDTVMLYAIRLYETDMSYAEWCTE